MTDGKLIQRECEMCGNLFYTRENGSRGSTIRPIRKKDSVTCSRKCSRRRLKIYRKLRAQLYHEWELKSKEPKNA